jgi:hypothetical protein
VDRLRVGERVAAACTAVDDIDGSRAHRKFAAGDPHHPCWRRPFRLGDVRNGFGE